jgi:hypothetical protein
MKDFRDDLLEQLLEHSGEYVDIMPIVEKHFGEIKTFESDDDTVPRNRLKINEILRELAQMNWIKVTPQNGFSNGHHMNHQIMKREYILDHPVKARMTTQGEIEYKKVKREQEQKLSIHVSGDIVGSIVGSHAHDLDFRPKINPTIPAVAEPNKAGQKISLGKWIIKHIVPIIITICSGLLIAYLAYRFGWNK